MTADPWHRITADLDAPLFVEAGAGTGKTTALVERVVALVARGAEMRHVAAITFTEAAAAELADRVRAALEALASLEGAGESGARARRALEQLDEAALTTIHGFARRLLADHPFAAGLPPALDVVDGVGQAIEAAAWWRATVADLLRDPTLEVALQRGFVIGLTADDLHALVVAMHAAWDRVVASPPIPSGTWPGVDVGAVVVPVEEALGVPCLDAEDRLCQHVRSLRPHLQALLAERDPLEALRLLDRCPVLVRGGVGATGNWRGEKDRVLDLLEQAESERRGQLAAARRHVLLSLLPALRERVSSWAVERRASGRPQFHDLLVWARDLLRDHPDVLAAAAGRWRHLLVDELQDVDPLQAELVTLLAGDDAERLFVVGDPKQSIYRFRGADIGVYRRHQQLRPERVLRLTTSYRSVPEVIDLVNGVFSQLFGGEHPEQAEHVPLEPARPAPADRQPPVLVVGGQAAPKVPMREVRRREAVALVQLVRRMKDDGWTVTEGAAERPVRYADVAFLIPTRAALPTLERALDEAGVPFRVESRSLVFSTDDVRHVLHLLAAIDDPGDEVAVVAALRSPALACTDAELLAWRRNGGRWDPRAAVRAGAGASAVARAMLELRALADERWSMSVGDLADEVVRRFRLLEISLAHRRPRDHWRRLRFIVDQARAYDEGGGRTVREFVAWAREQAEEGATVNEVVVPEVDDDAVRILTMHGSKGLEFPVVVLAGLGTQPTRLPSPVLFDADGHLEARVGSVERGYFRTAGHTDVHEAELRAIEAEELRLLYVAATRARDRLVVGVHQVHNDKRSIAARLEPALEACPERWSTVPPAGVAPRRAPLAVPVALRPEPEEDIEGWAEGRARLLLGSVAPATSATRVVAAIRHEPVEEPGQGAAVGRAVHGVMQAVDLGSGGGVDAVATACADAEELTAGAALVAALARSLLASSPVREASTGRHWREVYVAADLGDTLLEGFVDLLYETAEGLVVVDFKTDAAVDPAVERYRWQLASYAAALAHLGHQVARCVLVFARAEGDAVVRAVDVVQSTAEVRRLLRAGRQDAVEAASAPAPLARPVQQVLFEPAQ